MLTSMQKAHKKVNKELHCVKGFEYHHWNYDEPLDVIR